MNTIECKFNLKDSVILITLQKTNFFIFKTFTIVFVTQPCRDIILAS